METKVVNVGGVDLVVADGWFPKMKKLEEYPDCCGAGEGLGEKLVPDKILGLRISIACCEHDYSFEHAEATWAEFHAASFRFVRNIYAIIRAQSRWGLGLLRTLIASVYFYSVDTAGAKVFKRLKASQGQVVK